MKRLLCLILSAIVLMIAALSSSAFTLQSSRSYQSADDSGAYIIEFSGSHVDITRYTSNMISVGLDLSFTVSGVCAYHDKTVIFCDDMDNNQLIVYVYYPDSDVLDSFALYGVKLYGNIDYCCDDQAVYIENHQDNSVLKAYSYYGNQSARYCFDQAITAVCNGYHSGVYAVSDDTLYRLSGNGFTAVSGDEVEYPLFPAGSEILVSDYGRAYVLDGNRISRSFPVDGNYATASACVVGDRLYDLCGSVIYGYDISDGSKVSSYRLSFDASLLYADGGCMVAVGNGSYAAVSPGDFTELYVPDDPINSGGNNGSSSNKSNVKKNNAVFNGELSEISSYVYQVDYDRYFISGISSETTISQFKNNMHYNGWSVALYRDNTLKTSGHVGTAMTAVFTADGSSITFELSVIGDLTGEGNCNSRDIYTLLDYLIGTADFHGAYTLSADLSGDGNVDAVDAAMLKRKIG